MIHPPAIYDFREKTIFPGPIAYTVGESTEQFVIPSIGMQVLMLSGITGVSISSIFRGIVPFVIADLLHIALLGAVPAISLFIPTNML